MTLLVCMHAVMYLQHNNGGITLFGFALDRGLLHTLFAFEFSLVLWILSKVVVLSWFFFSLFLLNGVWFMCMMIPNVWTRNVSGQVGRSCQNLHSRLNWPNKMISQTLGLLWAKMVHPKSHLMFEIWIFHYKDCHLFCSIAGDCMEIEVHGFMEYRSHDIWGTRYSYYFHLVSW